MKENAIELLEKIVDIIYTPDQDGLNQTFIQLMDVLLNFISQENVQDNFNLNQELLAMQSSFIKKDYGELADILHYDLKSKLETVK